MRASELRIGNWITGGEETAIKGVFAVEAWHISAMFEFEKTAKRFVDWQPIPLTEEWLIRFLFKEDEPHWIINCDEHGVMQIMFNQYRKVISLFTVSAHYYMPEIKYVHQLQNLYFALTGEELICG